MALSAAQQAAFAMAAEAARAYRASDHDIPVRPDEPPGETLTRFRRSTPETGVPEDEVIAELLGLAGAGLMGVTHPRFHGWVMGGSHPVGVAADWLVSAWGQAPGFFSIGQVGGAAEQVACDWLLDILGLPADAGIGLGTGATMANFAAMAAARTALLADAGWDVEAKGIFGAPEIQVVLGEEAHSSVFLTLRMLGFGLERIHRVAADEQGRMRPEALERTLADLEGPILLCLQAGHIYSGDFDPFAELIPLARAKGAWVHVDGAFGLWAAAAPSCAGSIRGLHDADSWAADAHKWLQVPYDCGVVVVRRKELLPRALGSTAGYLPDDELRNPADFVPELSRRARGIPVWAVLRGLGRRGVAEMVERHCAVARRIGTRLGAEPGLSVLNEVVLNQVALAVDGGDPSESDRLTATLLARVQEEGSCFPSAGQWKGRSVIRISICSGPATEEDADITADSICAAWRGIRSA